MYINLAYYVVNDIQHSYRSSLEPDGAVCNSRRTISRSIGTFNTSENRPITICVKI